MSDADENKCFTFWENWYLMAEGRDTDEKRLAFYDALFRFAFDGEVPPKPKRGDPATVWAAYDAYLAASQTISRNMDLREQGRHGGLKGRGESKARVGNQNARKHPKSQAETQAKTEAKQNPNASQTQAEDASQTQANKINIKENKIKEDKCVWGLPPPTQTQKTQNQNADFFDSGCVDGKQPTEKSSLEDWRRFALSSAGVVLPEPDMMKYQAIKKNVPESYITKFLVNICNIGWEYMSRGGEVRRLNARNFGCMMRNFYDHRDDQSKGSKSNQPEGVVLKQEGYDASFLNGD